MATQASSVIYPNHGYAETSKKLRAFLPQASFLLKENVFAISGAISYLGQYPCQFDFYEYLGGRGMRLSIRAGMSKNQAEAKRLRLLAGECLVESAFLSEDKPRSEIALGMKNALSRCVATFEEETPKLADALMSLSNGCDQDARGTLIYVLKYFVQASDLLKAAGLTGLYEHAKKIPGQIVDAITLLDYRTVNAGAVQAARKIVGGIHATAVQLLEIAKSVLACFETSKPQPKQ